MKKGLWKTGCVIGVLLFIFSIPSTKPVAADLTEIIVDTTPDEAPQNMLSVGAASYKVPINVPPGRNGIGPAIDLIYNSYQKSGWVGIGWSLDLGAIQRSTKRGVDYSANDFVYTENGMSIELLARSDFGPGYYSPKIESSFIKYYFNSSTGGWEVTKKSGIIHYYGSDSASRQENSHGVFKWYLDRVEDQNGNFMRVSYTKDQGEIYLQRIEYTGNNSAAPYYAIDFFMEDRPDSPPMYDSNSAVTTGYRLKTIAVYAQNSLVRVYLLEYAQSGSSFSSLLTQVQEFGSDSIIDTYGNIMVGTALPPFQLTYSIWSDSSFSMNNNQTVTGYNPGHNRLLTLDINGDKRQDFILHHDGGNLERYMSNGLGYDYLGTQAVTGYGPEHPNMSETVAMDINGDGLGDFIIRHDGGNLTRYISNGSSFETNGYQAVTGYDPDTNHLSSMDINGDGKDDFIIRHDSGNVHIYISNGTSFDQVVTQSVSGFADQDGYRNKLIPMDINGDGRTDFVIHHDGGNLERYIYNGQSFDNAGSQSIAEYDPDHNEFVPLDINGDGRTDFVIRYDSGNMELYLSTGSSFVNVGSQQVSQFSRDPEEPLLHNQLVPMDINGDGRKDFVIHHDGGTLQRYLSKGELFEFAGSQTIFGFDPDANQLVIMDTDGNGSDDFIIRHDSGSLYGYFSYSGKTDLVASITNRLGGITHFEYTASSNCQNNMLPFIMHPVSSITGDDGLGNLSTTTYNYSDGLYDYSDREFRGFGYVKRTNPDGTTVETKIHQDEYFKGKTYEVTLKAPNSGPLQQKTTYQWDKTFLNSPEDTAAFVKLTRKRTEFYDDVTVFKQSDYTYDDTNGNLLTETTSGTDAETVTTTNEYQNFGDWLWRLTQKTVEGSESGIVRQTSYEYEQNTGNMTAKEFWLEGGTNPRVTMTYDSYGNQITVTDARGNTTVTEYDSLTNTYPVRITYPQTGSVSHIVENEEWDYRYGKIAIKKDENGNRIYYSYDPFGRMVQVDYPDGGQAAAEYYDNVFPRHVVTKIKEDEFGTTIDKYRYFDGLNREIQTIRFGENDRSIVGRTFYDEMGRVRLKEGPYFAEGVGYPLSHPLEYPWVQTSYDDRGRVIEKRRPDGEYGTVATTFSYSGFSKTITDADGGRKTEKEDYLGRIIQVTEFNDAEQYNTAYAYDSAGSLLQVTNHFGDVISISYDTLGRKTAMDDPDMGHWEYTYDPNGNVLTQTDAMQQTTTFSYDELNRILSKVYSTADPSVVYTYDNLSIPNGRGRLYNQTNTNVSATISEYDEVGRVLNVTKTISGDPTPRTTGYEYDFLGKTKKTIYPDAFEAAYSFYPGSNLLHTVIGSDQTVFATYSNYEPTGKMVQGDYGNGTQTLYGYDPMSKRLGSIFTSGPSGLPQDDIQDKAYRYSAAGDIIEISDNLKGVTYSYTYDKLHRLISETNTGTSDPWPSMVIENAHDTAHVHAVKTVNFNGIDYTNEYDANGNMSRGYDFTDPNQVAERLIAYNAGNMPVQIDYTKGSVNSITDIFYDGNGKRAKKSIQGGSATYYYGDHFEIKNGLSTKYIFAGNLRIAQIKGSEIHYFHKDHLGSSTAVSDVTGGKIETAEYLPFGMLREHTGTEVSNYKFTDQELDPETGLYNYDARLYDPVVGTFISPDPTVPRPFDPQSLNRFAYARNNPLRYIDPTGYEDTGEHDHESYGGDSNSDSGSSFHDYADDPELNDTTPTNDPGKLGDPAADSDPNTSETGASNETGSNFTDYSEPPETSSNPTGKSQIDSNPTNVVDDNVSYAGVGAIGFRGMKSGVLSGGPGQLAGGIAGTYAGAAVGAATGIPGMSVVGAAVGGWAGAKIGSSFDNPSAGQLNDGEDDMIGNYNERNN